MQDHLHSIIDRDVEFFLEFAFGCFHYREETLALFELINLVEDPRGRLLLLEVVKLCLKTLRSGSVSGVFVNRYIYKIIVSFFVFCPEDRDKFIPLDSTERYFELMKTLLKSLNKMESSGFMQLNQKRQKNQKSLEAYEQEQILFLDINRISDIDSLSQPSKSEHESQDSDGITKSKTIEEDTLDFDSFWQTEMHHLKHLDTAQNRSTVRDDASAGSESQKSTKSVESLEPNTPNQEASRIHLFVKSFALKLCKNSQSHPKFSELLKELKMHRMVQKLRRSHPDIIFDSFSVNLETDINPEKQSINSSILDYFLSTNETREKKTPNLNQPLKGKIVNYLFEHCTYAANRQLQNQSKKSFYLLSNDNELKAQFKQSRKFCKKIYKEMGTDMDEGLFFQIKRNVESAEKAGFLTKQEARLFQKVVTFLIRIIFEQLQRKSSFTFEDLLKYKRVFEVFALEVKYINEIISYLANISIESFIKIKQRLKTKGQKTETPEFLDFFTFQEKEILSKPLVYSKNSRLEVRDFGKKKHDKNVFLILLSWLFGLDDPTLLTLFIDKLSMYWKQTYSKHLMAKLTLNNRFDFDLFADYLNEIVESYEVQYKEESEQLNSIAGLFTDQLKKSRSINTQIREFYFQLDGQKTMDNHTEFVYRNKLARMRIFLKKVAVICVIRNLGHVLCDKFQSSTSLENLKLVLIPASAGNRQVRRTVRFFFLDLLNQRHHIFKNFKEEIHPIFPESKKTEASKWVLVDFRSFEEIKSLEQVLQNKDKSLADFFDQFNSPTGFYLFGILILNRVISHVQQDTRNVVLQPRVRSAVRLFMRRKEAAKYWILTKLVAGFQSKSRLYLYPNTEKNTLSQNQKIMIVSIVLWVVASPDLHPMKAMFADLLKKRGRSKKVVFDVFTDEGLLNQKEGRYKFHDPVQPDSVDKRGLLWHFLLHGFLTGIIEMDLIDSTKLFEGVSKFTEKYPNPIDYFVAHFRNDFEILSKHFGRSNLETNLHPALASTLRLINSMVLSTGP